MSSENDYEAAGPSQQDCPHPGCRWFPSTSASSSLRLENKSTFQGECIDMYLRRNSFFPSPTLLISRFAV